MLTFIASKEVAARFAADMLTDSRFDSTSITITLRARSEDCFVSIVTDTSLEDTVATMALHYLEPLTNTSPETTPGG